MSVHLSHPSLNCHPQAMKHPKVLIWTQMETVGFRGLWVSVPAGPTTASHWQSQLLGVSKLL